MKSWNARRENVFDAVQTEEREALGYQQAFEGSWVYEELNEVRNIKPAFKKWGLFGGVAYAGCSSVQKSTVSRRYRGRAGSGERRGTGIATPSSRRRVDGVEVDANARNFDVRAGARPRHEGQGALDLSATTPSIASTTAKVDDPRAKKIQYPKPDGKLSFPLLENVARAVVDHADTQPCPI